VHVGAGHVRPKSQSPRPTPLLSPDRWYAAPSLGGRSACPPIYIAKP